MLAGNPRPEEFDDSWPEPEQATWVTLGLKLVKADGTPVQAEFLRPRDWVERLGIRAGEPLPIAVSELDVDGDALVTGLSPCPPIAVGEGRVVTGRFVTKSAGNVVLVTLANGTVLRATDVHPVWSVDREEWVPAGQLQRGEQVDTLTGSVAVVSVERLESLLDVYNIEVHGEHVFRVTADGVLVHNACPDTPTLVYAYPQVGDKVYYGITSDALRRAAQHAIDPLKVGGLGPLTDKLPRPIAETLEAMLIRRRLADAIKNGIITGRETIREQLNKAGLLNKNRGRDPSRWIDIDFSQYFQNSTG